MTVCITNSDLHTECCLYSSTETVEMPKVPTLCISKKNLLSSQIIQEPIVSKMNRIRDRKNKLEWTDNAAFELFMV